MQLHDAPIELRDLKSNGPTKIQRCAEWFKAVSTLTVCEPFRISDRRLTVDTGNG